MPNPYPWLVTLTRHPPGMNLWHFPRKFKTEEAAATEIAWVESLGGKAELSATDFWTGEVQGMRQ
jgi:hypothetical protein